MAAFNVICVPCPNIRLLCLKSKILIKAINQNLVLKSMCDAHFSNDGHKDF